MNNNIPRGQLPIIILSALLDGDKYGLEIISKIKEQSGGQVEIKQPTLYSTLTRMEKQNFINSYWHESDLGGKRHYYCITDLGKKQFDSNNGAFYTDFWSKNEKTRIGIAQNSKYDEIEGFNFQNEEMVVQNKEDSQENGVKIQNIDSELKNLSLSSTSFFENLKNQGPEVVKNNDSVLIEESKSQNQEMIATTNEELEAVQQEESHSIEIEPKPKDDAIFLKPEETVAKQKTIEIVKPKQESDAIFIKEKINPESIPSVKKIGGTAFEAKVTPPIMSRIRPPEIENYQDKIKSLYDKTKQVCDVEEKYQAESISSLKNYYNEKGIKLFVKNGEVDKMQKTHFSANTHAILYKHLTIFGLVILETILCLLGLYVLDGKIEHPYLFALFPAVFSLPVLYFLFKSKGLSNIDFDNKSFLLSILIFILALAIIYCLNIPLGISFATMLDFKSTFLYPAIISTNLLVSAICDMYISRKYS